MCGFNIADNRAAYVSDCFFSRLQKSKETLIKSGAHIAQSDFQANFLKNPQEYRRTPRALPSGVFQGF